MSLRVGILGTGSIGGFVGGTLAVSGAAEVVFVGRPRLGVTIAEHGLTVQEYERPARTLAADAVRFETEPGALSECDAVLVCVKSAQTAEAAASLAAVISPGAVVASLQNGVQNAGVLRTALPDHEVLGGIVGYNVVWRDGARFHRTMSGALVLDRTVSEHGRALMRTFEAAGIEAETRDDLRAEQWTKLLVNLNNAVSALSGASTRVLLSTPGYRRCIAALVEEGVRVLRAAGIPLAPLRGVPVAWMPRILRLPTPLVRVVTRAQMKVGADSRSSMWEDLTRRRTTEVEYLNGEIVRMAEASGAAAPVNRRITALIHEAEAAAAGPPNWDADTLIEQLRLG